MILEYGLARLDRLVFYNSYAIWREVMGEKGVNLKDSRYGFNAMKLEVMREFARRAMCEELPKSPRNAELFRKRAEVNMILCINIFNYLLTKSFHS